MTRYLGLDLGSVTCGVSFSDTGFIARTIETIRFKPDDYNMERESGIPVKMQDERFTTAVAESILLEADVSRKKRKKKIDQLAAVQILQTWLDRNVK